MDMDSLSSSSAAAPPLPLPSDLVDSIFALLPAPDLLSAAAVCTSWRRTALTSPRPRPPSLLLHAHTLHRHLSSATTATSALEPNSQSWLRLPPLPSPPFPLHCSTSDPLLYTLSSSHLSFSSDPLHLRWTHLPAPVVWRVDPVVALVGPLLVAAGGVSEFEDNPLAVEVFDGDWRPAGDIPEVFKHCASAYYLSAAVAGGRLHIINRQNGLASSFDPMDGIWSKPAELLVGVDPKPFTVAIAAGGDGLVLAGVMGHPTGVTGVRLWEVRSEVGLVEIGDMPTGMVGRFARGARGESAAGVSDVEVRTTEAGGYVYVYNPSEMGEVFYFRAGAGGGDWGEVQTGVERGSNTTVVISCSVATMEELREALRRRPADV